MFKRELNAKLVLSVIATGIMSFSGVVVETAMNVTFPTLMEEFSIGTSTVQWMTTSYLLILAIIMPMSSYLNRRFKTKSIFTVAMIFYISGILCGFAAPTFMLLLLGRILEGIGTGLALPLMFNIITEQAPLKNMGVMMGIGMLVTAVAPAVGPSAGGWIAEHLGWRMIFAGLLPFLIVAFILGISSIQQSHETEVISFDVFGWLLLTVSFIALIFVIDESSAFGLLSIPVLLAIMIFVGSLMFFVRHENSFKHQEQSNKSTKIPIINLEVFSEKGFVLSLFAIVALQFIILGQSYLLPNFSQLVLGAGATAAGAQMLPGCAIGAVMAPISGQILDKLGAKKPIVTGILCCLTSMLLLLLFVHQLTVEMITYIFYYLCHWPGASDGKQFYGSSRTSTRRPQGRWKCCYQHTAAALWRYGHQRYFWRCSGFSAWSYRLSYKHPCRSSECTLCTCVRSLYPPCYHGNRALCTA